MPTQTALAAIAGFEMSAGRVMILLQEQPTFMPPDTLYADDFVIWTERQADALRAAARAGSNLPLDWNHLAEEIESLGSEKLEKVEALLNAILVHLMMLAASPAERPRAKWMREVEEFRDQVERVLRRNPSIRAQLDDMIAREMASAVRLTGRRLREHGEEVAGEPVLSASGASRPRCAKRCRRACFRSKVREPSSRSR